MNAQSEWRRREFSTGQATPIGAAADPQPAARGLSIRQRLIVIVLIVAIPLLSLAAAIVLQQAERESEAERQSITYSARAILAAVDAQLGVYMTLAQAFTNGGAMRNDDVAAFRDRVRDNLRDFPDVWVAVTDLSGRQLFNSLKPPGEALPPTSEVGMALVARAARTKQVQISDVHIGPSTGIPVIILVAPVMWDGDPRYCVFVVFSPDVFLETLNRQGIPKGWLAVVIDQRGNFVARSEGHDRLVGKPASPGWRAVTHQTGWFETPSLDGDLYDLANVVSPLTGWAVGLAAKKELMEGAIRRDMLWGGLASGTAILIILLLTAWAARKIADPIKALEAGAQALERHETVEFVPTGVPEVDRTMLAFKTASKSLAEQEERRNRAEMALKESEERFRAAQEASLDAFIIYQPIKEHGKTVDLRVVYANWPAARYCRSSPEAMQGRPISEIIPGSTAAGGLIDHHGRVADTGAPLEYVLEYDADGIRGAFQNLVVSFNGLIAATFRDVTASVEAKRALELAKLEADKANAAKSRFLAAASHDLRQPFQAMRLFHSVLQASVADPRQIAALVNLDRAMASGEALLTSLLDLAKLDAGQETIVVEPLAIAALFDSIIAEIAPLAAEKGLRLKSHCAEVTVTTDATMLRRIVANLASNALRYTEKGGILLACRRARGALRIEVWDTGIGIAPDQLGAIFDEFYQVENEERDRRRGLGLGLSIVQRLCVLMNYRLSVRSRRGKGTVFTVGVPLTAEGG